TWHLKASDQVSVDVLRGLIRKLAAQPPRYQLPATSTGHTRHYMPFNEGKKEKTTKIFDTFVVLGKSDPLIVAWDIELTFEERSALDTLLTRLSYLGRAESIVEAQLLPDAEIARFCADVVALDDDDTGARTTGYIRLLTPLSEDAYRVWLADLTASLAQPPAADGSTKKAKS